MLFGVRAYQYAFTLSLKRRFITEVPDEVYYKLCEILNLHYAKDHFSSLSFLREVDSRLPYKCSSYQVQPHEIAYHKRTADDEGKIYFHGWNDHLADERHVSEKNIVKTRRFLGDAVANFCGKNNISSMWTDIPKDKYQYTDPPGY